MMCMHVFSSFLIIYNNDNDHAHTRTVGSLNAEFLRYNADIISTTLKLWGKLDENVSRINTFTFCSFTSLHFISQNTAYRVTRVLMQTAALRVSAHMRLSPGNNYHKCVTTLIPWGERQFLRNFQFQQDWPLCMIYLCKQLQQMCDNTDILRWAPTFKKLSISTGLAIVHDIFLY